LRPASGSPGPGGETPCRSPQSARRADPGPRTPEEGAATIPSLLPDHSTIRSKNPEVDCSGGDPAAILPDATHPQSRSRSPCDFGGPTTRRAGCLTNPAPGRDEPAWRERGRTFSVAGSAAVCGGTG